MDRPRVVILGSGNVASHLAPALAGVADVTHIWSRHHDCASRLSRKCPGAIPVTELSVLPHDADFYIIAVPDDAVATVAAGISHVRGIVAHTSGSVPVDTLTDAGIGLGGVFYPLQTFSRERAVDMRRIPFFIEGSNDIVASALQTLAEKISDKVYRADSRQRATLHLGAVFACNFANRLWQTAGDIVARQGYDLEVYRPLLEETLDKAMTIGPRAARTGPAARRDMNVIAGQMNRLDGDDREVYALISRMIMDMDAASFRALLTPHQTVPQNNEQD